MYKKIKIGDKEVPMMSMASTDIYYKNTFNEDPLKAASQNMDAADAMYMAMKVGFIMNRQTELSRKDMLKLNEEAYLEWLDQFPREDYVELDTLSEIMDVYNADKKPTSTAKNQADQ